MYLSETKEKTQTQTHQHLFLRPNQNKKKKHKPQQTTNSSETLAELVTLLRSVGDKLQSGSKVLVLVRQPLQQRLGLLGVFHLQSSRLVHPLRSVLGLFGVRVDDDLLCVSFRRFSSCHIFSAQRENRVSPKKKKREKGNEPPAAFLKTYRVTSKFSHTINVSTAPISNPFKLSSIPNTNRPVSSAISSKYFWMSFFSWTNLTFDKESAARSMA